MAGIEFDVRGSVSLSWDMEYDFGIVPQLITGTLITSISYGLSDSVAPPNKEGVISDPMLLYSICLLVYLGVTCKISDQNLKI